MASIDQLVSALDGARESESGWTARCPAHQDRTPSLSISERGGKVLVHCHAGCSQDAVLGALESLGVALRRNDDGPPDSHASLGRASRVWDYYTADGRHVGRVLRFDAPGGKTIRPLSHDGTRWVWRAMPELRPLYRLPELTRRPDDVVLVTEGEKAADAAQKLFPRHVVTTWPGGASAVRKADWSPLRGRQVILWPDADEPGRKAMDTLAGILRGLGCTASRVNVAALGPVPAGWDAADCTTEQAARVEIVPYAPVPVPAAADSRTALEIIGAADVTPEPIAWLWPGWLACGKFHVLAGAPGTGKTTLAVAMAAIVSSGGTWPDGQRATAGRVLMWSGEDDPADTLVPRLIAAGADIGWVSFVGNVRTTEGARPFDPATDVDLLDARLSETGGAALLIVDPIVNAVIGDSHKNSDVRRALAPLVAVAQKHNAAVLGISHFTKGSQGREPVERVTGSLAFGALARIVMIAAASTPDGDEPAENAPRLLARAKSNIGPDRGGFRYVVKAGPIRNRPGIETSWVEWQGAVAGSARELLAEMEPTAADDGSALSDAEQFLLDALQDGPAGVNDIRKRSAAAGHAWATIRRAKDRLGVVATKGGMAAGWRWSLPAEGAPKMLKNPGHENMSTFGSNEHLRANDTEWEAF